jgi:hypothetical protein
VGYGLFAARDFTRDEFIFHEAPVMTALFNEMFSADKALMQSQLAACRGALASDPDVIALAFPSLAAQLGVAPADFDQAARVLGSCELGKNLVHGQFAGSTVTRQEYESYIAGIKAKAASKSSETDARNACLEFFKHYAFQVHQGAGPPRAGGGVTTREACVYLLGSLVNHCCPAAAASLASSKQISCYSSSSVPPPGPNCSWRIGPSGLAHFIKPRHICVQARRDICEGEQLTWDYGKQEKGFECECETCRSSFMSGLGQTCGML